MRRVVSALAFVAVFLAALAAQASGGLRVHVLVPERGNMQYASFWLALGADYFADEGYDVELVVPSTPRDVALRWNQVHAELAVLPATDYPRMLAAHADLTLIANLLINDPTALVVRRAVHDRLPALRDVNVAVAPRLGARFHALELAARIVPVAEDDQNAAFHDGRVNALFAESPFVERAIVHDDAVVVVAPAKGDVPPLAKHVVVAFATRPTVIEHQRPVVVGMLRALGRAARLIHEAPNEAVTILARMFPDRDRRELEAIVHLYAPAIPVAPGFPWQELPATAALYAEGDVPDLAKVDLAHAVNYEVMTAAEEKVPPGHARRVMLYAGLILLGMVVLGAATKRYDRSIADG